MTEAEKTRIRLGRSWPARKKGYSVVKVASAIPAPEARSRRKTAGRADKENRLLVFSFFLALDTLWPRMVLRDSGSRRSMRREDEVEDKIEDGDEEAEDGGFRDFFFCWAISVFLTLVGLYEHPSSSLVITQNSHRWQGCVAGWRGMTLGRWC